MRMKLKSNKGITLIALVITIIVLLILAGVSIAMLTGENGLLTKASDSKKETDKAGAKEAVQMEVAGSFTTTGTYDMNQAKENLKNNLKIPASDIKDNSNGSFNVKYKGIELTVMLNGQVIEKTVLPGEKVEKTEKNNYTDEKGRKATVPAGFIVVPGCETIDGGLVISDNEADTEKEGVTKQALGNQFVWIPVASADVYQRDFSYPSYYDIDSDNTPEGSTFTDTGYLPASIQPSTDDKINNEEAERQAVIKYNGFYIGRYEAGKEGQNTVVCKNGVSVYNNITQIDAKTKAKELCSDNQNVECALCSGIQWDMVMKFVDGKQDGQNKIFNVRVYDSTRHKGSLSETGLNDNDKVQNIYDLEGNCFEYVAEKNNTSDSFVYRGGNYLSHSLYKASLRFSNTGSANSYEAFRPTLYIK